MDKRIVRDQDVGRDEDVINGNNDSTNSRASEEGNNMPALAKIKENTYRGLTLSERKLKEITISPQIKNGKVQLDKNDPAHRYIYEDW